jgi:heat shock protein HspQ
MWSRIQFRIVYEGTDAKSYPFYNMSVINECEEYITYSSEMNSTSTIFF